VTVYLVRHAAPVIPTPEGPDDMHRPLSAEGCEQARRLAPWLVALEPTRFASSPYPRAVQTIEPAARQCGLPVQTDRRLREWDSGLEPSPDFARFFAESWDDPDLARPGGESLRLLSARALAALDDYRDGVTIIGSHGTFISRALAGCGLPVDWDWHRSMPMPAVFAFTPAVSGCGWVVSGTDLLSGAETP
jgi:2,3-bisphosphoglycerate-dependent phosphoglycerate mutase